MLHNWFKTSTPEEPDVICTSCGSMIATDDIFCTNCGEKREIKETVFSYPLDDLKLLILLASSATTLSISVILSRKL